MEKMRAGRVVALGRMACETTEVRAPDEGEVLVRTQLAAICGSDLHIVFMGSSLRPNFVLSELPHGSPGHEGIGEVVESRHPGLKPGERVLTVPGPPLTRAQASFPRSHDPITVGVSRRSIRMTKSQPLSTVVRMIMIAGPCSDK